MPPDPQQRGPPLSRTRESPASLCAGGGDTRPPCLAFAGGVCQDHLHPLAPTWGPPAPTGWSSPARAGESVGLQSPPCPDSSRASGYWGQQRLVSLRVYFSRASEGGVGLEKRVRFVRGIRVGRQQETGAVSTTRSFDLCTQEVTGTAGPVGVSAWPAVPAAVPTLGFRGRELQGAACLRPAVWGEEWSLPRPGGRFTDWWPAGQSHPAG